MKNPLSLLKKALFNFLKSPGKSLVTLLVLFDNTTKANANDAFDSCYEVIFTPTGSGQSYTMEKRLTPCAQLERASSSASTAHCISGLQDYSTIYISSLSDIPRTDPKTEKQFLDTLGFAITHQETAAIVKRDDQPSKKIWQGRGNPPCSSISFFKTLGGAKAAPNIIDISPSNLQKIVQSKISYYTFANHHCLENERPERRCKMEL